MKWTLGDDDELRALVLTCDSAEEIAERMSKKASGVRRYAHLHKIMLPDEPDLRTRWAEKLPEMKQRLRAIIGGI